MVISGNDDKSNLKRGCSPVKNSLDVKKNQFRMNVWAVREWLQVSKGWGVCSFVDKLIEMMELWMIRE